MGRLGLLLGTLVTVSVPQISFASVLISEVAWMGQDGDANAEWIELYNNAEESVDLSGWTLKAVDGQPNITLAGVLGGSSYALLERTNDETVPEVSAFLVYTGSLGNTGELLELRNASGVVVDSVDGRDGWSIGGNNDTKETLQRSGTPSVGGWITGAPSPEGSVPQGEVLGVTTERPRVSIGGNVINAVAQEESKRIPALTLDIGEERTVSVGAPTTFLARAYKEGGEEIVIKNVTWNFGDGAVLQGREVDHTYWYPGEYVVAATGHRSSFLSEIQDTRMIVVHVVEPPVIIAEATALYVALKNIGSKTFDVSGFVLVSSGNHFVVPEGTFILPGSAVRFLQKTTQLSVLGDVSLYDPNGVLVTAFGGKKTQPQTAGVTQVTAQPIAFVQKEEQGPVTSSVEKVVIDTEHVDGGSNVIAVANAYENAASEAQKETPLWWWIFGLLTAIVTTVVGVFLIRREQEEIIEGFYIESEEQPE